MIAVYVNGTIAAGNSDFIKPTEKIPEECESKHRKFPSFQFSGVMINKEPLGYFLEEKKY